MKSLSLDIYNRIRKYVYLYARHLDVARLRYLFEGGSAGEVAEALAVYQNADGGFGYGIEPDCQNPNSQPVQFFWGAAEVLIEIGYDKPDNPIFKRFIEYIENSTDITERGVCYTISSNNNYPCSFWYKFAPDDNRPAECNINSGIGIIFENFHPDSAIYKKAIRIATYRLSVMRDVLKNSLGASDDIWQGLEPSDYASLIYELGKHGIYTEQECEDMYNRLLTIVKEYGTSRTYEMIAGQINEKKINDNKVDAIEADSLDALVDKLGDENQPWFHYGRLRDGEEPTEKYLKLFHIGSLWWPIKDAINSLKTLKANGRLVLTGAEVLNPEKQ